MNFLRGTGIKACRNLAQLLNVVQSQSQVRCMRCARPVALMFSTPPQLQHPRYQHSVSFNASWSTNDLSTWQKMKWDMGFYGKLQVPNRRLKLSGYNLYVCCTDFIDFPEFVKETGIPDTFNSWFSLLQLHLWLVYVKLSQMGPEGFLLKNHMYSSMWHGVEKRLEKFEDMLGSERRKAVKNFYSMMVLSIMHYDEAILSSDKLLANALWLQLFGQDADVAPDKLALMVEYIRKQVQYHDSLDPSQLMQVLLLLLLFENY
ncbi:ubiquinol-cytochrome-c reductase complex assembly factor 1 isoform X2 [Aplysia californica]|uniref:Ubiquinol-cytochrome-c reductase complex assembly factor 1 isoform X2 n=1 Tax=Aplysia californica TaxID=6500 RepID=A0ABM1W1L4_APLCA|nr:ubiquinol-cytochrome-c reductase complex assembly factor 1 isoform X2 [Aplysia californica]